MITVAARLFRGAAFAALGLVLSTAAKADGLQIQCTAPTACAIGGIQTTPSSDPSFVVNLSGNGSGNRNGELFIAILEPVTSGANFSSGTLWSALGLSGGQDHNISSTITSDGLFYTGADTGFFVTSFDTGQFLSGNMTSGAITLPQGSYPAGTIFVAFTVNGTAVAADSPWSESLLVTPEPGTLTLMAAGLIGLGGILRRRISNS